MFKEKEEVVRQVFAKVASKYDIMNDFMSLGLHRWWKKQFVAKIAENYHASTHQTNNNNDKDGANSATQQTAAATQIPHAPLKILDLAAGTGDISFALLRAIKQASVTMCDPSPEMLEIAKTRLINQHFPLNSRCNFTLAPAEKLPFNDGEFELCTLSFGLRNFTQIEKSLHEIARILKPGGRLYCLEFIRQEPGIFACAYKFYTKGIIPQIGKIIAKTQESYDYLAESIEEFYSFEELSELFADNGFEIIDSAKTSPPVAASFCLSVTKR